MIDGAQGEGGGQVLRTALTLSMLTGQAFELVNIRAKREKPGLLRQHLTAVLAAQKICAANIDGVELGSDHIRFSPGEVKPGDYHFAIGSAGSTVLVCQTLLPVLGLARACSMVTFEGGTHNGMSPSLCFLEQSYLPVLQHMGLDCQVKRERLGFYPAGGGKWQIAIKPATHFVPINLLQSGSLFAEQSENCELNALISRLPETIGQREITTAKTLLGWHQIKESVAMVNAFGPGNSFQVKVIGGQYTHLFEVVGEWGLAAERVAKRCVGQAKKFLHSQAAVEEHLADQLLLPMALVGSGCYTTTRPSQHTMTNIAVIKRFMDINIVVEQQDDVCWQITLAS